MLFKTLKKRSVDRNNYIAFQDVDRKITYKELYEEILTNSYYLLKFLKPNGNDPVVVFIDRNIESIVTFLSIAVTGNFYVPIDIDQPNTRISLIIDTLDPVLLVNATNKELPENFESNVQTINYKSLRENKKIDEDFIERINSNIIDTDPLYAKFTSGSTGIPKGVLISRRSVNDLVVQFKKEFSFIKNDVFGNQAPFDFDVSVKDIYNSINVGAKVVIIPRINFMFPNKLIDFLNEYEITVGIWAVSVLRIVENLKGFKKSKPKTLRSVMFSGEVMPNKVLNYWRNNLTKTSFVNLYGPTEITCNCSFFKVESNFSDDESLPIGYPFENSRILLLDENNSLVEKEGELGEICIAGSSLALGYYNNEEMTSNVFVQNPLVKNYEEKIYKTGDIGYYGENRVLMFSSRKDNQIKHMGHRIELGEIENIANSLQILDSGFCIYDKKNEKIVLFYQAKQEVNKQIYLQMLNSLPKYMVPNKMIHFEKLPLNNNAKIDRVTIKEQYYNEHY